MENIFVQDVCEVYIKDLDGGNQYFFGLTTKNDVTQTVKQEFLRGGIGNGIVGTVQSDKEIKFKVSTLLHNDSIYEIQSGSGFTTGTITVQKSEVRECISGKLTIEGTPKGSTVVVYDSKGKVVSGATYATGEVTLTGGVEGAIYTVIYPSEVDGQVLTLDSKKFPKNYHVELHTIAYDIDKNTVTADIFWVFNKALPNGGIQAQYEAGKGNGDEVEFIAQLKAGSTEYGKYVVVPRP